MAYGRVTEFTVTKEGAHSVASPSWENPANAPAPIASQGNWDAFSRMLQKASRLEVGRRRRAALALRWFRRGCRSSGSDSLLSFWVALEVAFAEDDDVGRTLKILKSKCAKAYGIAESDVESKTCIGKLFRLRSQVVHEGWHTGIHYDVLKFMQHLFWDLFSDAYLGSCLNSAPPYYKSHGVQGLITAALDQ